MGLIKAGLGPVGGVLADQWKEFFYCDSMDKDTLVIKGQKRVSSRSSNTKGSDNIISNGSGIAVADGQCMLIVEQGRVVEVCAEPGEFTYNTSTEPSIFTGKFGDSLKESFKTIGRRFTYGGDTGKDQRVYYINTKEIMDNKFGTPTPILFHVVHSKIGLDMETEIRCNGVYSYRISDPIRFYTNISSNVANEFRREEIDSQLKTEFVDALSLSFGALANLELRPSQIPAHTKELRDSINEELREKWAQIRGLTVVSIAMNPVSMNEEDAAYLKRYQRAAAVDNRPGLGAAAFMEQSAEAMKGAANNPNGAMGGFVGMGMGMNAMGNMGNGMGSLFGVMGQNQPQQQQYAAPQQQYGAQQPQQQYAAPQQPQQQYAAPQSAAPAADTWVCPKCGASATGKFCMECGEKKPEATGGWTCSCGAVNKGKFCIECGAKKPAGAPLYRCDKCGWQPADPKNPPRFCPECGDVFDDNDIK